MSDKRVFENGTELEVVEQDESSITIGRQLPGAVRDVSVEIGLNPNYTIHDEPCLNVARPIVRPEAITIALMQAIGISAMRFSRQHLVDASEGQLAMIQDGDDFYFDIVQPSGEPNG